MDSQKREVKNVNPKVIGRLFFKGTLENISALALSNGQDEYSDADIFKDSNGRPMIPATSFIGALKSHLESRHNRELDIGTYQYLFGYEGIQGKLGIQAHLIVNDLKCESDHNTNIRDGVKINPKTNLAVDQGKYDYEILEPGTTFSIKGEITYRDGIDSEKVDDILKYIQGILKSGHFQVGSLTSFGFGQLQLEGSIETTGILRSEEYIKYITTPDVYVFSQKVEDKEFSDDKNISVFKFKFRPTTPLFIGGGEVSDKNADDASLKSNGKYILSAKSLKGAIRHHAFRIANTVHGDEIAHKICNEIFGNRPKEEKEKIELTKSKFWTSDGFINEYDEIKSQSQVAIDRFTGGAIESALFATEPVWPTSKTFVDIEWRIQNNSVHLGLLLLVARDLMTEMLPVGGDKAIGRGRFEAIDATLNEINIKANRTWDDNDLGKINSYIQAFLNLNENSNGDK